MNLEEAIINRRAIYPKQFNGKAVSSDIIRKALELANWAPTHKRTEPWRFIVFENEDKNALLDQIAETTIASTPASEFDSNVVDKYNQRKKQVSHIVVIVMQRNKESGIPKWEEKASVAMAVQNMWLYLSSTGKAGGYWSTPKACFTESFSNFVGLERKEKCMGVFYFGSIDFDFKWPAGQRKNWQEKVRWNS